MIIPKVELGNLAVGTCEWFCRVPSNIVVGIEVVARLAESFWERVVFPLLRVRDGSPVSQWPVDSDAVVVNLITSTDPEKLDLDLAMGSVLLT
jgi:hypothetical protein